MAECRLRGWKDVSGTRTYYLYDGGDPVVEMDASGGVTAVNVYAPDGLVARTVGSTTTQYAFDPQGSVAQRLDASGSVLSSSVYDAYGAESSTSTPSDPFGYDARWGYVTDRETGLVYCQNRYYDPGTGRWLNRDPIGAAGGINVYGYCGNGPVGRIDPTGNLWLWDQLSNAWEWFNGVNTIDTHGDPVNIGGWRNWLNNPGNIMTYHGTHHIKNAQDYMSFLGDPHWQSHEDYHFEQNKDTPYWVFDVAWLWGATAGYAAWNEQGRPTTGGYYGHDWNTMERAAMDHADREYPPKRKHPPKKRRR